MNDVARVLIAFVISFTVTSIALWAYRKWIERKD